MVRVTNYMTRLKSRRVTNNNSDLSGAIRLKCPQCGPQRPGLALVETGDGFECEHCGLRKPAEFWRDPFMQWRTQHPQYDFLGFTEAAQLIGTCPTTLRNAVHDRRLVAKKISCRLWVVTITELERFYAYAFRHRRRKFK